MHPWVMTKTTFVILTVRVGFFPLTTKKKKMNQFILMSRVTFVPKHFSQGVSDISHSQECNRCADGQMIWKHITSGRDKENMISAFQWDSWSISLYKPFRLCLTDISSHNQVRQTNAALSVACQGKQVINHTSSILPLFFFPFLSTNTLLFTYRSSM